VKKKEDYTQEQTSQGVNQKYLDEKLADVVCGKAYSFYVEIIYTVGTAKKSRHITPIMM
jgi:hypothetical protein